MKKINKKFILILASVAVLLLVTVGGTVAYIVANTSSIVNTFNPSKVTCAVVEDPFSEGVSTVKKNVKVQNTGDTDAYIRVAIVGNWHDTISGQDCIVDSWEYTGVPSPASKWVKVDSYYYYTEDVPPNEFTSVLIDSIDVSQITHPQDYPNAHLEVTILAQAVQSSPAAAVAEAWGVNPANLN